MRTAADTWAGRCRLVAEIGCNHQGDPGIAERLVALAREVGATPKGQIRDVWESPPEEWGRTPYGGPHAFGPTYLEHRRALELPVRVHRELLRWHPTYSVSIWDLVSARAWLEPGDAGPTPSWVKLPSARLTDEPLLRYCAGWAAAGEGRVLVLSTGMSVEAEVVEAIATVQACGAYSHLILLACTSAYPCEAGDVHLRRLDRLRALAPGVPVGVSGHWRGIQIDAAAVAMGARVIERHITLDRTMRGSDHAASLEPVGLRRWARDVGVVLDALGRPELRVLDCEESARRKLRGADA